jgi:hypothetical protein
MKQIILSLLVLWCAQSYGQDYMTEITNKTCACLEKAPDDLEEDEFNMMAGTCMIEASIPYKKQILKDYNVNMDNIVTDGEKWGGILGVKIASVCPNALLKMAKKSKKAETAVKAVKGTITKIEKDAFVAFSLKEESGKTNKYYWLSFITSNKDLVTDYTSLTGKAVDISYIDQELFDPKIGEYRLFYIITNISIP